MARTAYIALHQALEGNSDFLCQVCGALWRAAADVENEDPGTENHAARIAWAAKVRKNRKAMARTMLGDILKNSTIAADVDNAVDGDVLFVVASLIDTFATE